jgi:hypothetical protein
MTTAPTITRAHLRSQLFPAVAYEPHAGQRPVHDSRARHRVVAAGRRIGKSTTGGHELLIEAYKTGLILSAIPPNQRREFWIVGPEYSDAEKEFRTLYDACRSLDAPFDKPGTYYDPHTGDLAISLFGGKFLCIGKSAKHPERLVGEGLSGVIMAEAAKQRERTWTKYIRPTLADNKGWSLHTSTPEGKNWFYDLWQRGQSSNPAWQSWRLPSWINTHIYPGGEHDPEIQQLRADLSAETFNQEVAALFTEYTGRVFKDFDEEVHVKDLRFNPRWETYAAVDYGFTNPTVWLLLQVDPFKNVHVIDEFYETGLTPIEAAQQIQWRGLAPSTLKAFYPDPASPADSRILSTYLRIASVGGTGGDLDTRLNLIRAALKPNLQTDGTPRLLINRSCTNTIREFNDYRYPQTTREQSAASEKPLKKDDHTPEALGRFYAGYFGDPTSRTTVRRGRYDGRSTKVRNRRGTRR